jgi:hypothetical protein
MFVLALDLAYLSTLVNGNIQGNRLRLRCDTIPDFLDQLDTLGNAQSWNIVFAYAHMKHCPGCRNIGGGPAVRASEVIERLVPSIAAFHDQW